MACVIYFAGRSPFIGQWDSFDYLKQIVTHRLSDLGVGRPVFIGFNIVLWEFFKKAFSLAPLQVGGVVMAEVILLGAMGVLVFASLSRRLLPAPAARLAVPALLLSPMYALYSGFVMTEVPMLAALMASALILRPSSGHRQIWRDLAGGAMFGLAVGIREQALSLAAAFLWLIWIRHPDTRARLHSLFAFAAASVFVIAAPALALYLSDPPAFARRMQVWLRAIPMGPSHFWKNLQASLIYTFALCPAAWLAVTSTSLLRWFRRVAQRTSVPFPAITSRELAGRTAGAVLPAPVAGLFCCLILPVAALWRDADVQIHPRYAMVALPAALIFCTYLYSRWATSRRAAVNWMVLHLVVFGLAQTALQPLRQIQEERREYAREVLQAVPGEGMLIAGAYSPIMDYYRALGERPHWQILWSGWGWSNRSAESAIRKAWASHIPVYLCQGPLGWLYFEDELLDLYFFFRGCKKESVFPGLVLIHPDD